jgi:hypothetical protein
MSGKLKEIRVIAMRWEPNYLDPFFEFTIV